MMEEGRASTSELARILRGIQDSIADAVAKRDDGGIHPLSRVLGGIETSLQTIQKTLSEDRVASAQYRTDVRKELQDVHDEIHALQGQVREVTSDVAEIKPKVISLEQNALMSKGARGLIQVLVNGAHLITATAAAIGALLLDHWWRAVK